MTTLRVDGNNVLDMYAATALAAAQCRRGEGPVMIVAHTFRMGGHATHDEREARDLFPAELFAYWGQRDPIGCFEFWLMNVKHIDETTLSAIEDEVALEMEAAAADAASKRKTHEPDPATVLDGVYA